MADETESVDVKLPSGETVTTIVPTGMKDDEVHALLKSKRPELFQEGAFGSSEAAAAKQSPTAPIVSPGAAFDPSSPESIGAGMKQSKVPGAVRGTTAAIPAATGTAGAILGAGSGGPPGSVVGGGIGAAGGEAARQLIDKAAFGAQEGPQTSGEAAKNIGITGGVGAALEIPGALAGTMGRIWLKRLANAADEGQVGDVLAAMKREAPGGVSKDGLIDSLEKARTTASSKLTPMFSRSTTQHDVDALLNPIRQQAQSYDIQFARQGARGMTSKARVSNALNDIVEAAKIDAGIRPGMPATTQQLADFQRAIQDKAFKTAKLDPSVGGVVKGLVRDAYRQIGGDITKAAPASKAIMNQLTDIHAAQSALKNYSPGMTKSIALSAAVHPRSTAVSSIPLSAALAKYGGKGTQEIASRLVRLGK